MVHPLPFSALEAGSPLLWEKAMDNLTDFVPGPRRAPHEHLWEEGTRCWGKVQVPANSCVCSSSQEPGEGNQGARAFIDGGRGLYAETAQSALTVILRLVISDLTSVILIVLNTVNLQFQGQFVPISLRPVLRIAAAYAMATARSSCS